MPTPSQVRDREASRAARQNRESSSSSSSRSCPTGSQKGVPIRPNFGGMKYSGGCWVRSGGSSSSTVKPRGK